MSAADVPMFAPADVGLTMETWDDLPTAPEAPKCQLCDRPLRSKESRDAGIGPCCAAKIGRAVIADRRAAQ